jgi:DNA primase
LKYITCPKESEIKEHKTLLYNIDKAGEECILVEGIFDVWKIELSGYHAVCPFGVEITPDQICMLMNTYKKIHLLLDPDKAGQKSNLDLMKRLSFAGIDCYMVENNSGKDPGDMSLQQIREMMERHEKEVLTV